MSDQTTDEPQSGDGEQTVDPSAAISRGVGLSLESIEPDSPAGKAVADLREFATQYKAAEDAFEALKQERMQRVYDLKTEHNVGFSAQAEILGVTSSLILYLFERSQGKTSKQIREESVASRLAKEATRVEDPNKKPARKQTPAEKELRKRQREELRRFLAEQAEAAAARGETDEETAAAVADLDREEADEDQ